MFAFTSRCIPTCTQVSITAKPVLSGHSEIDKQKTILMTNCSLKKVESIAERAIIGLKNLVLNLFLEWPLTTGFTVFNVSFEEKCN